MATDKDDYHTEDIFREYCAWHEIQKWKLESLKSKSLPDKKVIEDGGQKTDPDSE